MRSRGFTLSGLVVIHGALAAFASSDSLMLTRN
jgi:hypothetical protein